LHVGRFEGALDVVRDVVGWNTFYHAINDRPYAALSRNWSSLKFGGFGVWLDDVLYHGVLANVLDRQIVMDNLRAALAGATEAGNLLCLLTGRDAWIDRSQSPIATYVLWLMHLRWSDVEFLRECYPILLANHEWWWRERDGNNNGLLEYGTSPVGRGLYRGTKLAAKDESTMDNSPIYDEASLDKNSWTLDCEDVGLNSIVALDAEMLANVANELGEFDDVARLTVRGEVLKQRISTQLWDPERQVFANRLWSGKFVDSLAPTSFFPLIAGAASPSQAAALLEAFHDLERFGGAYIVPSVTRNDPAYPDNVYWRGRVWPPLNYLVYHGLRCYDFRREASLRRRVT
jgi:putative isomerase